MTVMLTGTIDPGVCHLMLFQSWDLRSVEQVGNRVYRVDQSSCYKMSDVKRN